MVERTEPARSAASADRDPDLAEVLEGLRAHSKHLPTKYHYDEKGSRLFEAITTTDEYYLTRTERALLRESMPSLVAELLPRTLVELGAGSAEKSRIILDAMVAAGSADAYVPVDVSDDFLAQTARALRAAYPGVDVVPEVADFTEPLDLPRGLPHPRWIAFLGSTLGNFDDAQAIDLLSRVATRLHDGDRFLLGVDLRPGPSKSVARIEAAYNDGQGITRQFSRNILTVLNDTFGSDFDLDAFEHRSVYVPERGRIETDLECLRDQVVRFPGEAPIRIAAGERIRTEISAKYDRPTVESLFQRAGLRLDRWIHDPEGLYALVLSGAAAPSEGALLRR